MNALFGAAADLQALCEQERWRFCFIGGLAVLRWGEPRETVDVDLTLLTGFGGEEKYIATLMSHFAPRVDDAPRLSNIRATLHLPSMRTFRLCATLYVLAGLLTLVAAVTRLEAAFASIVAVACFAWIGAWSYAIVRTWNAVEPTVERSIP